MVITTREVGHLLHAHYHHTKSNTDFTQRRTRTHDLELKRQDSINKTDSIARDEEARLLNLKLLALQDDHATLKDKISQKHARITALTRQGDLVRVELDESKEAARAQEKRIKKQDIELANLKVCGHAAKSRNPQLTGSGRSKLSKWLGSGLWQGAAGKVCPNPRVEPPSTRNGAPSITAGQLPGHGGREERPATSGRLSRGGARKREAVKAKSSVQGRRCGHDRAQGSTDKGGAEVGR